MEQFFPAKHPLLQERDKIRHTFQLEERSSYLVVVEEPNKVWLDQSSLNELKDITALLKSVDGVLNITSLTTIESAHEEEGSLSVGPIYDTLEPSKWSSFTSSNDLLRSQLISQDFHSALIILEPKAMALNTLGGFTKNISRLLKDKYPNLKVAIGGSPAIQGNISEHLFKDLRLFLILSLISFCIVFAAFFRGVSAFILTLSSLAIVNLVVIGALAYFEIPFTILLSTLPIVVSISLISVIIHTTHRWAETVDRKYTSKQRFHLAYRVIKEMALPNFLGSITTSIGFSALYFTDIPLIQQYGAVVAITIMFAWLLTHIIMLGFMYFTTPVLRAWTNRKSFWALPILKQALPICVIIGIATLGMAYSGKNITFSGRLFDDLPESDPSRQATEQIDDRFGGVVPYDLSLKSPIADFWKEPKNLELLSQKLKQIQRLEGVGSVISLPSFFMSRAPQTRQEVGEFLFLYSMNESNPLKNYITEDGTDLHVSIRMHDVSSLEVEKSRDAIKHIFLTQFPDLKIMESGIAVYSHTINQEVAKDLVFSFWHSILVIGLLLMVVFRSLRWALIACLPNLLPPAVLIGSLAIAQTPVKPGVALIFSIALGLAFNNTVYLLSRIKRIMKEKNMTALPLKSAILQEGNPCLFETLIMFFGFVIFLASDFKINQIFGVYMLISIVAGAIGDIVLLPAILKLFPAILRGKRLVISYTIPIAKESVSGRVIASLLTFSIIALSSPRTSNAADPGPKNEGLDILKKSQQQVQSKDDQATVSMKIIESNGDTKVRTMQLETLTNKSFHALARIQAPADIKGTGFLAEVNGDKEEQWIYLPSNKQVRRVVGTKKSAGVLGSELTVEDLNSTAVKNASVKLVKKEAVIFLIEADPKPGTSVYSKILMTISASTYLPQKTEYYQNNQLKKTVDFLNYKKFGNIYRAQTIQVRNLDNKRGTDLELKDVKINAGLRSDDFSVGALKAN